MSQRRNKGFTLAELLIVMVLLSMLAIIGLPTFQGTQKKSRDNKRKADLTQIAKTLEMYANDVGRYPCQATGGLMTDCGSTTYQWGDALTKGNTVYMQKLPKDPLGSQVYYYEKYGNVGKGFRLWAHLENADDPDIATSSLVCSLDGAKMCNYVVRSPNLVQ